MGNSYRNSLDKIVNSYFAVFCKVPFEYKGKLYQPKLVMVSQTLFRGFSCSQGCGGCCKNYTLEYLPSESHPKEYVQKCEVEFNGRKVEVFRDLQEHEDYYCRYVDKTTGWCQNHDTRAIHCDFELLRIHTFKNHFRLSHAPFGRVWAMRRVDGIRGGLCKFSPCSKDNIPDLLRKLNRLEDWFKHFQLASRIPEILSWVSTGPHSKALYLPEPGQKPKEEQFV